MLNKFFLMSVLALILTGCAGFGYQEASMRGSYDPVIPEGVDSSNAALIKAAGSMQFIKVGSHRVGGGFKEMFTGSPDSVYVEEGRHTITAKYGETPINVGAANYVAGHEYLLDYMSNGSRIYYWVKDLTTGDVVYGRELTPDDV